MGLAILTVVWLSMVVALVIIAVKLPWATDSWGGVDTRRMVFLLSVSLLLSGLLLVSTVLYINIAYKAVMPLEFTQ